MWPHHGGEKVMWLVWRPAGSSSWIHILHFYIIYFYIFCQWNLQTPEDSSILFPLFFFKYVKFSLLQIKALTTDDFVSCTPRWGNVIVCYATSTKLIWFDLTCTHSPGAQITTHAEGVCDVFVCSGRHYSPLSLRGEQLFAATLIF